MAIEFVDQLQPLSGGADYWSLIRGKDIDITEGASALTGLADADIFLVDDDAAGIQSSTKYITAANIATYMKTNLDGLTIGVDDTGYDVKFFGATASRYWLWDEGADGVVQRGTLTIGVDDTGHDVKFFGASAGAYMEWDESVDQLRIMGASADATTSTGKLLLATSLTDINANDVLGKIEFQAPHEAGGTDAITVSASIEAVAQGTFAADLNATDLIFKLGHSEAATEKLRITSEGEIGIGGANYGTDGQVLTSGGAGQPCAWEDGGGSVSVANSTANTYFPVVLHDESDNLLDDNDGFTYNPSSVVAKISNLYINAEADSYDNTADSATGRLSIGEHGDLNLYHGSSGGGIQQSMIVDNTGDIQIETTTAGGDIILKSLGPNSSTSELSLQGDKVHIDRIIDNTVAGDSEEIGLLLDLERGGDVSTGHININKALKINLDQGEQSDAVVTNYGIHLDLDAQNTSQNTGTITNYGIKQEISQGDVSYGLHLDISSVNESYGIYIDNVNGQIDYKSVSSADSGDYFSMATTAAGATTLTTVDDDGEAAHLTLAPDGDCIVDRSVSLTADGTYTGLSIDFDKDGASTGTNTLYGLNIDMDNTTATNGGNVMYGIHNTPTLTHAADAGAASVTGLLQTVTGSSNGTSFAYGISQTITGADTLIGILQTVTNGNKDLIFRSSADPGDQFSIATTAHGATTIATEDDDATKAADLTLDIDGDIVLKPAGGNVYVLNASDSNIFDFNPINPAMIIRNSLDTGDYFKISVLSHGATTIKTVDDDATKAADLTLDVDGDIELNADGGTITFKDDTTTLAEIDSSGNLLIIGALTARGHVHSIGTAGNTTASTYSVVTNTGSYAGKDLTIAAGSTTTGLNNLDGGDLILKSGDGDGTGTSAMTFFTKVNGTDATAERMRIHTNGMVGIGTNNPGSTLMVRSSETTTDVLGVYADSLTTGNGLNINIDDSLTSGSLKTLIFIDYDKSGVTDSANHNFTTGLHVSLVDAATNHASGVVSMVGAKIDIESANAQGTIAQTGLNINVADDSVGDAATTLGIGLTVMDGGTDIKLMSSADTGDYCSISTTTHGATTIATEDDNNAAAHLTVATDGNIVLGCTPGGAITLQENDASVYTPSASSDATTKTYVDTQTVITANAYNNRVDATSWYLMNNDTATNLTGTDTTVGDTQDLGTLSNTDMRCLMFIVPYNMTIHAISGSVMDDDMDEVTDKRIGLWRLPSLSVSGADPGDTNPDTLTLAYITDAFGASTAFASGKVMSFYDTSADVELTAGDGIFMGYLNPQSAGNDDVTLTMSIWAHQTTP